MIMVCVLVDMTINGWSRDKARTESLWKTTDYLDVVAVIHQLKPYVGRYPVGKAPPNPINPKLAINLIIYPSSGFRVTARLKCRFEASNFQGMTENHPTSMLPLHVYQDVFLSLSSRLFFLQLQVLRLFS